MQVVNAPRKGHSSESKHRRFKSSITVNSTATKAKRSDERKDGATKPRGGDGKGAQHSVRTDARGVGGGGAAGLLDDFHSGKLQASEGSLPPSRWSVLGESRRNELA